MSALPIREQKPNPLPDRKALDDIVFEVLGLTEDERNDVYWAVASWSRTGLRRRGVCEKERRNKVDI